VMCSRGTGVGFEAPRAQRKVALNIKSLNTSVTKTAKTCFDRAILESLHCIDFCSISRLLGKTCYCSIL